MAYLLTEKLWYTADKSRAVADGDPAAAFLLGVPGQSISDEEAARLGLTKKAKADKPVNEVTPETEEKAAEPTPNKKKTPAENKGKA